MNFISSIWNWFFPNNVEEISSDLLKNEERTSNLLKNYDKPKFPNKKPPTTRNPGSKLEKQYEEQLENNKSEFIVVSSEKKPNLKPPIRGIKVMPD